MRQTRVMVIKDRLDISSVEELKVDFIRYVDKPKEALSLILDLSKLEFLDSSGIAFLLKIKNAQEERDGRVACVWPEKQSLKEMLHLTRMHEVFLFFENKQKAQEYLESELVCGE